MKLRLLLTAALLLSTLSCHTPAPQPPAPPLAKIAVAESQPATPHTAPFIHPGILHTTPELAFLRAQLATHKEPWTSAYAAMQKSPKASLAYTPHPIANLFRGSRNNPNYGASDWLIDGGACYTLALEWALSHNPAYAEKSLQILNAYSHTVQSVKGSDAPLVTGESTIHYVNAAELLRSTYHDDGGFLPADQRAFEHLLRDILYPVIKDFKPANNGNWDAAMIQSMLAMGVYLDDQGMFNRALYQATLAKSNGAIRNYFDPDGECQESGRDQGHAQMGLGFLGCACEIAWNQGVDLYGDADNRLAKGFEYTAKYNLGNDVPYRPYVTVFGKTVFPEGISPQSRGRFNSIYEKIYHHYHDLEGLPMPYTKQVIDKMRPEADITNSHTPWGTLMFADLP
jgi:hypothetical protein